MRAMIVFFVVCALAIGQLSAHETSGFHVHELFDEHDHLIPVGSHAQPPPNQWQPLYSQHPVDNHAPAPIQWQPLDPSQANDISLYQVTPDDVFRRYRRQAYVRAVAPQPQYVIAAVPAPYFPGTVTHHRVKRADNPDLKDSTQFAELKKNYPLSPVEAFFGQSAHTHTFGMNAGIEWTPLLIGNHADLPLENNRPLNFIQATSFKPFNYQFAYGQSLSTINQYPDVDWAKLYGQYQDNVHTLSNGRALPYQYTPTAFFGRSPFNQDMSLGGGLTPIIMRINNAVDVPADNPTGRLGLRINQQIQNTTDQWGHAHTLEGVNAYKDINWPYYFNRFTDRHAAYKAGAIGGQPIVAASTPAPASLINVVNPNQPPAQTMTEWGGVRPVPPNPQTWPDRELPPANLPSQLLSQRLIPTAMPDPGPLASFSQTAPPVTASPIMTPNGPLQGNLWKAVNGVNPSTGGGIPVGFGTQQSTGVGMPGMSTGNSAQSSVGSSIAGIPGIPQGIPGVSGRRRRRRALATLGQLLGPPADY